METIGTRDLRGKALLERARKGEPLAITDYRVLIGVIVPAAQAWAQHLICQNWPQVEQDIAEAEAAMASGSRMTTVEDLAGEPQPGSSEPGGRRTPAVPLEAAIVDGGITQTPQSNEVIRQLHAAWNPLGPAGEDADNPSLIQAIRPVRIGDLSAALIRQAGVDRQALAVTHGRELVGILVPVTQDLVQFLIEQNMSRVLSSIEQAEEHIESGNTMVTLDDEIPPKAV